MDTVWMVLTFLATYCGRSALRQVLSVCLSPRHGDMSISNRLDFSTHLVSGTFMMLSVSLRAEVSIRSAALAAFQLEEDEVSSDLVLSVAAAAAKGWAGHQEQPVDQNAPEADRRNVPDEVISVNDSEVDSASSHGDDSSYESGSYASNTYTDTDSEPPVSEVSDQYSMLDHAYHTVRRNFCESFKSQFAWQAQYSVILEDAICCSAHCK